jgi:hypothetical protein
MKKPNPKQGMALSNTSTANLRNNTLNYHSLYKDAVNDGRILAELYFNLKSGLCTFFHIWERLEDFHEPFHADVLRNEFYTHIEKHPNTRAFLNEIMGGLS